MTPTQPKDCAGDHDPRSLTIDQALARIRDALTPVAGRERLPVREALGRVLAEAVESPHDVPGHRNSAMDGYAVRSADLAQDATGDLETIGTSWAGAPYDGPVAAGQCVRIMTGAKLPDDTDTVVMQEHVERNGERIRIGAGHRPGQNVRHPGEDIAAGSRVLEAGRRLQPADLGLITSLGVAEVTVHRRPRVAYFSTGDELRPVGEPLGEGDIYDSNRYTLHGMLHRLGVETLDMGVVRDRREDVERAFTEAAACVDAIISTGGVSVGEADYVEQILEQLGEVGFWKIAVKPGRPFAFGHVQGAAFFGLPGNPVSVMATFYQLVQPALRRMAGEDVPPPLRFKVRCASSLKKRPGRMEFQRGTLERGGDGELEVRSTGLQGSHVLSGMSRANCFIVLPADADNIEAGTLVEVEPFEGLI